MIAGVASIAIGVLALAWSADQFVVGAARVALLRNVPPLVVGLVIIGFGTSAPEFLVSALAAADGQTEVALGNVLGSNLANLTLLLGLGAIIVPLTVESRTIRREAPLVLGASIAFALVIQQGSSRIEGVLLIVALAGALAVIIRRPSETPEHEPLADDVIALADALSDADDARGHGLRREIARTLVGLIGTIGSAQILLWGALRVADETGLSGGFVGVTLVAIGTSLPELVTVVQSARRHQTDLIVGNLLGSNLFNALAVGGVIGLIGGPAVDNTSLTVTAAFAGVVAALMAIVAMATSHTITRAEGAVMVAAYLGVVPFLA